MLSDDLKELQSVGEKADGKVANLVATMEYDLVDQLVAAMVEWKGLCLEMKPAEVSVG